MCNTQLGEDRLCFDLFEPTCWGRGLGPGICKFYHFFRFSVVDGKRQLRSNCAYYAIAIPCVILYPIWFSLYLFVMMLVWPVKLTISVFKDVSCGYILLLPFYWIMVQVATLLIVAMYIYCYVLFYTMFTIWCGLCRYADVPVIRLGRVYNSTHE